MNFGYFCNTTNWTHKPYHKLLDETREITEYCDQGDWNSIWYTEHHFNHEGMESLTNPLMMGVDAAARTKNIRIGQKEIIHFLGIGGIGMSGLAQVMKTMGFNIQGSDQNKNKNTTITPKDNRS